MKNKLLLLYLRHRFAKLRRAALMTYLCYHYSAYMLKSPKRVSILTGAMWVDEMLQGNEDAFVENFRMPRSTFHALVYELAQNGGLLGSKGVRPVEQLCIFLYFAGHKASSVNMQQRFQHSGETITRHLRLVVASILRITPIYIRLPPSNAPTPSQIATNTKFYPFFANCRMAIDGTHIPVWVPSDCAAPFHGRKGITMNVLAACDFNMMFTYILAGWEGTAADGKLYADALNKGLTISSTQFDIMDAGFALTMKSLTPYRGTRYRLKEYGKGRLKPRTKEELFNLRHAQLRNCIEKIFGILKMRFPILFHGIRYNFTFQVDVVLALCTILNFVRMRSIENDRFETEADDYLEEQDAAMHVSNDTDLPSDLDNDEAKTWRDGIANAIWTQYQATLQRRRRV